MTFTIPVQAEDRRLVTQADVVAHLGTGVASRIPMLDVMIRQVSDLIATECGVARSGALPPTLRRETILETFNLARPAKKLILSRRFVDQLSSITEDGSALGASHYRVDQTAGIVERLDSSGRPAEWCATEIVALYTAGFDEVPGGLKLAAIRAIHEQVSASSRDPLLKSESVDGISRFDYWVNGASGGSASGGAFSPGVLALLNDYRSYAL
jgi:hypothetical protein